MKKKRNRVRKRSARSMTNGDLPSVPALDVSTNDASIAISSTSNVRATNNIATQASKKERQSGQSVYGFIFMCIGKTKPQCYQHRVFGLPTGKIEFVKGIRRSAKLFLYNFDEKLLYCAYKATCKGGLDLEPAAFNGRFSAQVRALMSAFRPITLTETTTADPPLPIFPMRQGLSHSHTLQWKRDLSSLQGFLIKRSLT